MGRTTYLIGLVSLLLIVSCHSKIHPKEPVITTNNKILSFTENNLSTLYEDANQGCYPYSFVSEENKSLYEPYPVGTYISGLKGLLLYCNFPNAVKQLLVNKGIECPEATDGFYNLRKFECLARMNIFTGHEKEFEPFGFINDNKQDFHRYNPAFVRWAVENLIPKPTSIISGKPAQDHYTNVFSRFFRMMTSSYVYLLEHEYDKETEAYNSALIDPNFNGFHYLLDKYKETLPNYAQPFDYSNMNGSMAIGFWLRRKIDKSHQELWMGLTRFMLAYDKPWFLKHVAVSHYR